MPQSNEEIIKTIETSDFLNGGLLNPAQQEQFITYVKEYSTMLDACRTITMTQQVQDIDKMHISEPITESAAEATEQGSPNNEGTAKYNKVTLTAVKLRSTWNISTETLQNNIEQDAYEDTLMQGMTARIATDMEMLSIQGDTSLGTANKTERLLNRLDGWDIQSDSAHIVDVEGGNIDKDVFRIMKRSLPKQYRSDPGLRWIMSDSVLDDWVDYLAEQKVSGTFGNAIQGQGLNPLGIQILTAEMIPDNKEVAIDPAAAGPAEAVGYKFGPFNIVTGSNDTVDIDCTNTASAATTINFTLTPGTLHASEIAAQINTEAQGIANCTVRAKDDGEGRLKLYTTDTGSNCDIDVQATGDFQDTVGLEGYTGASSASGTDSPGVKDDGSFVLLANPQNFLCGILAGTRLYTKYNEKTDTIENIVYNQMDVAIENIDAIVKAKNISLSEIV